VQKYGLTPRTLGLRTLGGAHFYYNGFLIYCCDSGFWSAHVTMTQEDFYTFVPTGPWGIRRFFRSYEAAHELETTYGYLPFWHSETWFDRFYSY
jgi:hypothetical protein